MVQMGNLKTRWSTGQVISLPVRSVAFFENPRTLISPPFFLVLSLDCLLHGLKFN